MKFKKSEHVRLALDPLWSVLHISGQTELVTTLHGSFPDYMFDLSRSKQYHCDRSVHNEYVARLCFDCLARVRPQFNICGLESSFFRDDEVQGIEERIQGAISTEMFYASRYWAVHLHYTPGSPALMQQLEELLSTRLLLWMEVMSLRRCASDMPQILRLTETWEAECSPELKALTHDAWRFTSSFALGAAVDSTPHIYTSILAFWSENSPVSKCYRGRIQGLIKTEGTAVSRHERALLATWSFDRFAGSPIFSPNGTQIAVGLGEHVHLLSSSTGRTILPPFKAHRGYIVSIHFSPDGSRIVSSDHETVYVWSTQSGTVILGPLEGISGYEITQVAFSPNGLSMVSLLGPSYTSASKGHEEVEPDGRTKQCAVRIWDALGGIQTIYPSIPEGIDITATSIGCLSGKQFVIVGHKAGIMIYDLQGVCTREVLVTDDVNIYLSTVEVSPDGVHVAAVSNGRVLIFDLESGNVVLGLLLLLGTIRSAVNLSFSPNGFYLAVSSYEQVCIWDIRTGDLVLGPLKEHGGLSELCFSPDGAFVICVTFDRKMRLWDARDRNLYATQSPLVGHKGPITSVGFHPGGTRLISGSAGGTICVWDAVSGEMVLGPLKESSWNVAPGFSPQGNCILLRSESNLIILDPQTDNDTVGLLLFKGAYPGAACSPDGSCVAIIGDIKHPRGHGSDYEGNCNLRIIAVNTSNTLWSTCLRVRQGEDLVSPTFTRDGLRLVVRYCHHYSAASDHDSDRLHVYDARSGELLNDRVYGNFNCYKITPDSTSIISYFQSQIIVQEINTGKKELRPVNWDTNKTHLATFSPDCAHIAIVTEGRTLDIYDTLTGQRVFGLTNWHTSYIWTMNFSPDGTHIASGLEDDTIRVIDIQSTPTCLSGSSPDGFGEWNVRDDGWVMDESSKLLAWIPPNLRASLMVPRTKLLISVRGHLRLKFESAYIGESWANCYKGA